MAKANGLQGARCHRKQKVPSAKGLPQPKERVLETCSNWVPNLAYL